MRLIAAILFAVFWTPIWSVCPSNSVASSDGSKCFYVIRQKTDFDGAGEMCSLFGGHLASIVSSVDNDLIHNAAQKMLKDTDVVRFWIGAHKLNDFSTWQWDNGEPFGFNNWATGNIDIFDLNCAAMNKANGTWSLRKCCDKLPYICASLENPQAASPDAVCPTIASNAEVTCPACPTLAEIGTTTKEEPTVTDTDGAAAGGRAARTVALETTSEEPISAGPTTTTTAIPTTTSPMKCDSSWDQSGTHCYRMFYQQLEWQQAEDHCREHGSHLVSIHSEFENTFIFNHVTNFLFGNSDIWIGVHSPLKHFNLFAWSDYSTWTYHHFRSGEPSATQNEYCVEMLRNKGDWNNLPCDYKRPYICKKPLL